MLTYIANLFSIIKINLFINNIKEKASKADSNVFKEDIFLTLIMMIQTIVTYTLMALSMFYFTYKSRFNKGILSNIYFWMPIIIFTFVFGIRYGVGIDYFSYKEIYENYDIGDWTYMIGENLFYYICDVCSRYNLPVSAYFSILSFLQILFIYLAFKNRKVILAYSVLALFLTGIGVSGFNNIIRQAIAFCIFIYSLTLIEKKQLLYYFLCILLAFSFHLSAIILLPIYFLFYKGQNYFHNTKLQMFILLCCFLVSWINIGSIISIYVEYISMILNYHGYFNTHFVDAKERSTFTIVLFFVNIFVVYFYPRVKLYYKDRFFEIVFTLFYMSICLGYLLNDIHILWRVLVYFSYLKFIVFGYYLIFFKNKMKTSCKYYISAVFFISYLLGFYCYSVLYKSYNSCSTYSTYYQVDLYKRQETMNLDYMHK